MAQDKIQTRVEPASAEAAPEAKAAKPTAQAKGIAVRLGTSEPGAERAAGAETAPASKQAEPAESARAASEGAPAPHQPSILDRAGAWLAETFPNSRHAVIGGICGLIVALLLFTIGVLDTLVVAVCIACGVAAGQYLDGDPKIARIVQSLLKRR